ncbi:MAG: hypothetical protein SFX18_04515 [Pirellulales bacterium]|nr:hypothetical protein [Pirellulales bacterium]
MPNAVYRLTYRQPVPPACVLTSVCNFSRMNFLTAASNGRPANLSY